MSESREESIIKRARRLLGGESGKRTHKSEIFSDASSSDPAFFQLLSGKIVEPADDCAVWKTDRFDLLTTADMLVEGTHFLLPAYVDCNEAGALCRLDTLYNVGWKALAVNVSDIAANGGEPLGYLICLGIPAETTEIEIDSFTKGLRDSARRHRISIWGGDLVKSNAWTISITAVGAVPHCKAITRSGAKSGDILMISGTIGLASLALNLFMSNKHNAQSFALVRKTYKRAFDRLNKPTARIELGVKLRELGIVTAMLDTSDSLAKSVRLLAYESGLGACIDLSNIKINAELRGYLQSKFDVKSKTQLSKMSDVRILNYFFSSAEDYEILFTVSPADLPKIQKLLESNKSMTPLNVIGEMTATKELKVKHNGKWIPIHETGFEHFL